MTTTTRTEHGEQSALMQLVRMHEGRYPDLAYLFAVPNGGQRSKATAGKLSAEGVRPGVPDLLLPIPRGQWVGLAIEMKVGRNRPTADQHRWLVRLTAAGWRTEVCYSTEDAWAVVMAYVSLQREELVEAIGQ